MYNSGGERGFQGGPSRTVSSCISYVESILREQWELVVRNAHFELERGACNERKELLRLCMKRENRLANCVELST